jgi:Uma2 family endonuclease
MATAALTWYTPEEYLALERNAEFKSEYIDGRIVAMTGAPDPHVTISLNVHAELRTRFRGRACRAWAIDMRVQIEGGRRYTYPDVVALCGEKRFIDGVLDTLMNPTLIVEVLSPSTEAYDRGEKFLHYRAIETLQEYVLVAQDKPLVERFVRHGEFWHLATVTGLDSSLELTSVGCTIPLREIYENVEFPASTMEEAPAENAHPS